MVVTHLGIHDVHMFCNEKWDMLRYTYCSFYFTIITETNIHIFHTRNYFRYDLISKQFQNHSLTIVKVCHKDMLPHESNSACYRYILQKSIIGNPQWTVQTRAIKISTHELQTTLSRLSFAITIRLNTSVSHWGLRMTVLRRPLSMVPFPP